MKGATVSYYISRSMLDRNTILIGSREWDLAKRLEGSSKNNLEKGFKKNVQEI